MLAAAHLDHDPANNRLRNLRSLCQRCHMLHDRSYHLMQRWITYRLRYAAGDLFLGPYRRGDHPPDIMLLPRRTGEEGERPRRGRFQPPLGSQPAIPSRPTVG